MRTKLSFKVSAITLALGAAFGNPAVADQISELTKPESTISFGIGNWSKDRPQQGIYDGASDEGPYGLLDMDIVKRDDETGTWISFFGRNLGLDNRELRAEYLRQGQFGASIEYSQTPRDNPFSISTRLQGIGTSTLVVNGNATPSTYSLSTRRDMTKLGVYKNLLPGLDFNLTFKNEDKEGERQWGQRGQASGPNFAVEPIRSNIQELEAKLNFTGEQFQLSGGLNSSWYKTDNTLISKTSGATTDFVSQPLANEALQWFLEGGYSFSSSTRATFKLSYSEATQDEVLPTSRVLALAAGAPNHLDGKLNTTLAQVGVTSRLTSDLSLTANLRYHDLDDETPQRRFVTGGTTVDNTPLSYTTTTAKAEATYRLSNSDKVALGAEHRAQDRSVPVGQINGAGLDTQRVVPMRNELEETTYRAEFRHNLSETINGAVSYNHIERRGSSYVSSAAGAGGAESNLINPINVADRDREKIRAAIDWSPIERISLQLSAESSSDDYLVASNRPYGLLDGKSDLYALDASFALTDDWQITGWYSVDSTSANQLNRNATAPLFEMKSRLKDSTEAYGLGLNGKIGSGLKVGSDIQWSKNTSSYKQSYIGTGVVSVGALPNIVSKSLKAGVFGEYALSKTADIRFDAIHERWETNDWTWQFANGSTFIYGDGTTVTASPKQIANYLGMKYTYRFQ